MLLVLGRIAGDRLVAELGELDPSLLGGDTVEPVSDDRPVAARRRDLLRRLRDRGARGGHPLHRVGQLAQTVQERRSSLRTRGFEHVGE